MTYASPTIYRRTPAEMADQALGWARADRRFFAAGACHILAWALRGAWPLRDARMLRGARMLRDPRPLSGLEVVGLRRVGDPHAFHVIARDGAMAFDYAGWTPHEELLAVVGRAVGVERPGTVVEEVALPRDLEAFCKLHNHRLPHQFPGDVWARARAYLAQVAPEVGDP